MCVCVRACVRDICGMMLCHKKVKLIEKVKLIVGCSSVIKEMKTLWGTSV